MNVSELLTDGRGKASVRARKRDGLLILLFLLALALPATAHLMGLWQATSQTERRPLSQPPTWPADAERWHTFAPALESYLADHIGLRPVLVTVAHRLRYWIAAPVTHDVLIGTRRDGALIRERYRIGRLEGEVAARVADVAALRSSLSWRLTVPVRAIGTRIKHLRRTVAPGSSRKNPT